MAAGHTAERFVNDYGYDLNMFTYGPDGGQEPGSVFIQVKATESLPLLRGGKTVSFPVRWSDITLWRREPMPVILVVHDVTQQVAYWLYVQELLESRAEDGGLATAKYVSLHLSTDNIVDEQAVERFREFKQSVLGQTEGVKHRG